MKLPNPARCCSQPCTKRVDQTPPTKTAKAVRTGIASVDLEKCHPNVTRTDSGPAESGRRGPKVPMFIGCRRGDCNPKYTRPLENVARTRCGLTVPNRPMTWVTVHLEFCTNLLHARCDHARADVERVAELVGRR
jgi:hypothetical protein